MNHMWLLCVCVLTDILILSESAEFEVLIGGMNVGRSSSCLGENVTYVYNFTSSSHIWNAPDSVRERTLLWDTVSQLDGEYTSRIVSVDGTNVIASSLSVSSSAELNGTIITCAAGFDRDGTRATTVAMVLDPPSLPELSVNQVMEDSETVYITVTPPSVSSECVLQYTIIYSYCEGLETNITVYPNNTGPTQPVQFTRGGLNLCTCRYNFTAVAVTRNSIGARSAPVTIKISDIVGNPDLTITNDGFIVTVSINPQEPSVFVAVKHSSAVDTNCVVNVERNTNITSSETILDCSFAELTPTFCVQFIDGSCQSELVRRTTATKLPSLLSGVKIYPSTSSIDVIVDLNEGINCNTSQLSTRTTISDESGVININTGAFRDQVIVFEPPSPGLYTCNISIMSGNIVLKSMEQPCSNTDTSSTSQTSTSVVLGILITFIVSFLLGLSLGSLLTWCLIKRKESSNQQTNQPSSGPVYEIVSPQRNTIELESNKAYGYVK